MDIMNLKDKPDPISLDQYKSVVNENNEKFSTVYF